MSRRAEMSAEEYQRLRVTEAGMEAAVAELVALRGGRMFHVRRSDVAPELADLPDWLILAPWKRSVLLYEAKSQKRIITPGQEAVLAMLAECNRLESGIVRPSPRAGEVGYTAFLEWLRGGGP